MSISILHPSRGRPQMAYDTFNRWVNAAKNKSGLEYIISLDPSDVTVEEYKKLFEHTMVHLHINKDEPGLYYVQSVNNAAKLSKGEIIIINSDDFEAPDEWDVLILGEVADKKDWILKTWDGVQPWILTIPIMDRTFYESNGWIYYPEYKHMYSDTDLTSYAEYAGKLLKCSYFFKHNHYTVTGKHDETSVRADSTYPQGEAIYRSRFFDRFGVKEIKNIIREPSHVAWLEARGMFQPKI